MVGMEILGREKRCLRTTVVEALSLKRSLVEIKLESKAGAR